MKHVSLPIAISMTLIWLSEGKIIFGGLSVRGAVKRQTERKSTLNSTSFSPVDSGSMIYSLNTTIKAFKWEQIHRNIMFKEWTEKKGMNYYDSKLPIQSFKQQCTYFQSSSCFNNNAIRSL